MKTILFLAAVLASGSCVLLSDSPPTGDLAWAQFKAQYSKTYKNHHEESYRKTTFLKHLKEIEAFNAAGHSYQQGVNQFTDMTHEETVAYLGLGNIKRPNYTDNSAEFEAKFTKDNPDNIDWRNKDGKNYISGVRDQGQCGSCWSFSVLGSLESLIYIHGKVSTLAFLSEQMLVDCFKKDCNGAWMGDAWDWIKQNGIQYDSDYPYVSGDGQARTCTADVNKILGKINGYYMLQNEGNLMSAVAQYGPASVGVCVPKSFPKYKSGVYDDEACNTEAGCQSLHAIVAVGYGNDATGGDYWIVKNSWSEGWGDQGYIKIARGKNRCFIGSMATVPW